MIIEKYQARSLVRNSAPSLFSWAEVNLNPYNGCFHDCKYCDGKAEHYHMHPDFSEKLRVKENAVELLERFLKSQGLFSHSRSQTNLDSYLNLNRKPAQSKSKFILFLGGGVCDVYQPEEQNIKLTRHLLELIRDYNVPVQILTKNKLVQRDIDLLKEINKTTYAAVNLTITLADPETQKIFEPRASSTKDRFTTIKRLRDEGIHSGVYFYPVLPFIGDTDINMEKIYTEAKRVDAEFVYCWGLTLKPGKNKDEFLKTIQRFFPSLLLKYKLLYGNNNKYGILDYKKIKKLGFRYPEIKAYFYSVNNQLPYASQRYIPKGRIHSNLAIAEIFRKMAYLKSNIIQEKEGIALKLLKAARILEKCPEEAIKMSKNQFKMLFIPSEVHPFIIDYFLTGKISELEEIEKRAFESSIQKIN
jgi:DNA repair photolyase